MFRGSRVVIRTASSATPSPTHAASRLDWKGRLRSLFLAALGLPLGVAADPFPPAWGPVDEAGGPVHFAPVPWPNEPSNPADCGLSCGDWKPYSRFQNFLNDPRVRDPSNGGTSPQNYVNVASSCVDTRFPSIYYNLRRGAAVDGSQDVILFRWRVEQIANTYATGPNPGNFGATDPWNSALWTVFFDIDGDGFRDLAAHLNGSSGSPSQPIDMIAGIWGDIPTQSIDYLNDPNIRLIAHNPTAFVSGSRLLNFQNSLTPSTDWGSAPRSIWDYGTTRSRLISTNACNEYFIDYQIPVRMLDASPTGPNPALNGPKITRSTPIAMMFCSANSLNNPTQKDCAINDDYASATPIPGPFGDYLSFDQEEPYSQPIISSVTATAPAICPGPYRLSARVQDTLAMQNGSVVGSVKAVDFLYWFDANANGEADEAGGRWTRISPAANPQPGSLNTWNADWDATGLPRGAYLVGVQAVDDRSRVDQDMLPAPRDNRTFSYVTGDPQGAVHVDGSWASPTIESNFPLHQPAQSPVSSEDWYGNPEVTGQQIAIVDVAINACGESPTLSKVAAPENIATGETVDFTVTLANTTSSAITLAEIEDVLPPGFQFVSTLSLTNDGAALTPTTEPTPGALGSIAWTFPDVSVAAGRSLVLSFAAQAGPTAGAYTNVARALTSAGALDSPPATVGVDAARLSLSKTPDRYAINPDGSTVLEYTLRWSNDSAVALTAATLTDPLPADTTYVSCAGGLSCGFSAPNVVWQLGDLAAGANGEVSLRLTVDTDYATPDLVNTASFSAQPPGGGSVDVSATSTIAVNVPTPAFSLEKSGSAVQVAPAGSVTWTLTYRNFGTGAASGAVLTDELPDGFSFSSCSVTGSTHFAPCSHSAGVVTFTAASIPAGGSGSVSITVTVAGAPFPFANPATNTASLTWTGNPTPVVASDVVGVTGQACSLVNYLDQGGVLSSEAPPTAQAGSVVSLFGANTAVFSTAPFASPVPLAGRVLSLRAYVDAKTASADLDIVVDRVLVGGSTQNITTFNANPPTAPQIYQFTTAAFAGGTPDLAVGERLRLTFVGTGGNLSNRVELFFGGTQTFNGASTYTDSLASVCLASSPAALDISKRVDTASVSVLPSPLQYTIEVSNPGGAAATGAVLTDTLPAGVSLVSVLLNGSPVTPSVSGQQFSLPVNSVGQSPGVIAAGGLGTIVVNATATASASGELINTASLSATGLGPVVDTAVTQVGVPSDGSPPALQLSKSVAPSLLSAGDTATFRLTVVNTGGSAASAVVVSDDFPEQAWFTYVDCTPPAGDSCSQAPAGSLQWTVGSLRPGDAATLEFRMRVATTGVPSGATVLQNVSTVVDADYCTSPAVSGCTSNTVDVTVSGQPRLQLSKSAAPVVPYVAEDVVTYSLVLTNTGASDATDVQVLDPLPPYMAFAGGITASSGSGSFDPVDNRVVYQMPLLAAGTSATLSFNARVVFPLPQGSTAVTNTATASASNAPPVQDSVPSVLVGTPELRLDKQGASSVPYPAAVLSAAASGSSFVVDSAQRLQVGDYVRVGSSIRRITSLAGRTVGVDGSVSAAAGAPVAVGVQYALLYSNEGDADASSVVLTDTLPVDLVFAAASVAPSSAPAVGSSGTLSFNLGTLAAGERGQLQINAIPVAPGSYTNSASLAASGLPTVDDSIDTQAGGLVVDKRTTTPVRSVGELAEYFVSVRNTSPATINGIELVDPLPSGFTFSSTVHVRINGGDVAPTSAPSAGDAFPTWGSFNLPAGQTLEIRFLATIGPDVGPATYDNGIDVSAPGAAVTPFDPLSTPAEDVTVLGPDQGLVLGVIYADIDLDGSYDPAIDTPLPGAEVLVRASDGVVYVAYADFEGRFQRVVPAGSTLVNVAGSSLPPGLVPTVGGDGENPNTVLVPSGGSARDDNGFVAATGSVGNLVGRVFDDPNEDGIQNLGEAGRLGIRVELRDPVTLAILFVTYTDLLGDYSFTNVPAGNYIVRVERPSGTGLSEATPNNRAATVPNAGTERVDFGLIVDATVDTDLAVTKTNGVNGVVSGGVTTWTVVARNDGPLAADGATLFDPASAGLVKTAVSCTASAGGASCPPMPTVLALEAGTLAIPTFPAGGSVTLEVVANVTAAAGQTVSNTVSVSPPDGVTDVDPDNNSATDTDPVGSAPAPELTLVKTASPSPFTVGVAASYTLTVSNTGSAATTLAITITDAIPASLTLGALPAGCTALGQTVTCTVPGLAVGESANFVIPVTPTAGAAPEVRNTASASGGGDPGCPAAARCSSTIDTPVNAPGLNLTKSASLVDTNSNGTADAGEVINYSLTALNSGNVELSDVTILDARLPSLVCAPVQPATLSPAESLVCTGSYTVTPTDVNAQQPISNTATATGTPPTGPDLIDSDTALVPVTGQQPSWTLDKSVVSGSPFSFEGDRIDYAFDLVNTGGVGIDQIVLVDDRIGTVNCPQTTLAPGQQMRCLASYVVTRADRIAGEVINIATATGQPQSGSLSPAMDQATVPRSQTCAGIARIEGRLWSDLDRDGQQQPAEPGLSSLVSLAPASGQVVLTAALAPLGDYRFATLSPGTYRLAMLDSYLDDVLGLVPVGANQTEITVAACDVARFDVGYATPQNGRVGDFVWYDQDSSGNVNEFFDADGDGQLSLNPVDAPLPLDQFEWIDLNGNGVPDAGEFNRCGISGVRLQLLDGQGQPLAEQLSNARGAYTFGGLALDRAYSVRIDPEDPALQAGSRSIAQSGRCLPFVLPAEGTLRGAAGGGLSCTLSRAESQTSRVLTLAQPDDQTLDFGVRCATDEAAIGIGKQVISLVPGAPYRLHYRMVVRNFGQLPLQQVQVLDDLSRTFPSPIVFEVESVQAQSGLVANPGFDGRLDTGLLLPGSSALAVGEERQIDLRLRLWPNGASGRFDNVALARAQGPDTRIVEDDSVDGAVADPDLDGVPDELGPTPIQIGSGLPEATVVPVNQPAALLLMLLAIGLVGAWRLRQRGRG